MNSSNPRNIKEFVDSNQNRRDSVHSLITQIRSRKSGRQTTKPKPFHLMTNNKPRVSKKVSPPTPYVPLAVKLQKLQSDTPERFHKKPKVIARILNNELTLPKSPALVTKLRAEHSQ